MKIKFLTIIFLATLTTDSAITKTPMADSISISVQDADKSCLSTPRWWAPQADLGDGKVLIAGGQVHDDEPGPDNKYERTIDSVEIVDAASCTPKIVTQKSPMNIRANAPVVMSQGRVAFFGGGPSTNIYIFDPVENFVYDSGGDLIQGRSGSAQTMTVSNAPIGHTGDFNDLIMTSGGYDTNKDKSANQGILATAENIQVRTVNESSHQTLVVESHLTGPMHYARSGHSISVLNSGQALVIGGKGFTDAAKDAMAESYVTAELYSEEREDFKLLKSHLNFGRKDHRAVTDGEGRIWLIGGTGADGNSVAALEYYDPTSGQFVVAKNSNGETLKLLEPREDTDAVYNAELNVIVVAGGEIKYMQEGKSIQSPSDAIDVIDLNNFTVTSSHSTYKRDDGSLETLPGDPNDGKIALRLLQGVDEKHFQVKSEMVVVERAVSGEEPAK